MSPALLTFGTKEDSPPLRFKIFGLGGAGCNLITRSAFPSVAVGSAPHEVDKCVNSTRLIMSAEELQSYADIDPGILTPNMLPSDIRNCFYDHDISILTAGLGGATGSKGIKLFSSASRKMSRGSISIVSMPFSVESENRRKTARETLNDLTNRS
ncbi:MAG: hypothetical protein OEV21_02785, partial [Thermoplasmata archaeon]|nr:hypothetical protein [Thermoplasmata archaeon]